MAELNFNPRTTFSEAAHRKGINLHVDLHPFSLSLHGLCIFLIKWMSNKKIFRVLSSELFPWHRIMSNKCSLGARGALKNLLFAARSLSMMGQIFKVLITQRNSLRQVCFLLMNIKNLLKVSKLSTIIALIIGRSKKRW